MCCGMNTNLGSQKVWRKQNLSPQQREDKASLYTAGERFLGLSGKLDSKGIYKWYCNWQDQHYIWASIDRLNDSSKVMKW